MTATPLAPFGASSAAPEVRADRIAGDPEWLLDRLPGLGPLLLRASNGEAAVSVSAELGAPERCGRDRVLTAVGGAGTQLRVDPARWNGVFALADGPPGQRREGLRVLGDDGEVALIAGLTVASDRGAFRALTEPGVSPRRVPSAGGVSAGGDAAEGSRVAPVAPSLVIELLETLAEAAVPVRLQLPGTGLMLAATGLVASPVRGARGLELKGAGLEAEVGPAGLVGAEVRRLDVPEGYAHALDLLNRAGRRTLRLTGQPVYGCPEDGAWRDLLAALGSGGDRPAPRVAAGAPGEGGGGRQRPSGGLDGAGPISDSL